MREQICNIEIHRNRQIVHILHALATIIKYIELHHMLPARADSERNFIPFISELGKCKSINRLFVSLLNITKYMKTFFIMPAFETRQINEGDSKESRPLLLDHD